MQLLMIVIAMLIGGAAFATGMGSMQAANTLLNFATVGILIQIYLKMKRR